MTPERLLNPDKEPQNWLMNHRTYDGQRFSPLARINKDNVKNLKLAYAVPLGGGAGNEFIEATPLAEDGFLYITDSWGVLYKIDGTVGRCRPHRLAHGPQAGEAGRQSRRRAVGQSRHLAPPTGRRASSPPTRTPARSCGKPTFRRTRPSVTHHRRRRSPIKDKIIVGAAGGDARRARLDRRRSMPRPASVLWRKYTIPAPGEPGSETWKDNNNAWQTGGGAVWVTGTYDPDTNQTIWGTGNPVPMFDPTYRPGDNLYTNSAISWDPDTGKMNWYFQYTPGDMWDLRRGRHPHPDRRRGRRASRASSSPIRRATASSTRWSAHNGQIVGAKPYMDNVNWTKGIDQKTGKPLDYDPGKDIQTYSGVANPTPASRSRRSVPIAPAATITGRRPTARRPSCSIFRR